jgi:hypothetical protein
MTIIDLDTLMLSEISGLIRLGRAVGAKIPDIKPTESTASWKYRVSCNILRSLKRNASSGRDRVYKSQDRV